MDNKNWIFDVIELTQWWLPVLNNKAEGDIIDATELLKYGIFKFYPESQIVLYFHEIKDPQKSISHNAQGLWT